MHTEVDIHIDRTDGSLEQDGDIRQLLIRLVIFWKID